MEKINNKVLALSGIVIVIIAGAGLALLSNKDSSNNNINPTSNPTQKEYTIIRMPNESTWVTLATVADDKGFFEEEGIKIEWTGKIAGGGPGQLASIAGRSNDVGSAAVMAIINAINKGVKIKAIGPEYEIDEQANTWYVLENSSIRTAKDLVGKKIAVNTLKANAEYTIKEYLSQNGVPFDKVELVVVDPSRSGNPFLTEEIFRRGEVDMMPASEVIEWNLLKNGGVRPLVIYYDIWGKASGNPAYVVSEEFMKKNPDATRRFVTALAKAADYINANPEEALQIEIKRNFDPDPDSEPAKHIKAHRYPEHALISEEQVKQWIDRMVKYGDLKEGQIKPSDIYTNEFNRYYKK